MTTPHEAKTLVEQVIFSETCLITVTLPFLEFLSFFLLPFCLSCSFSEKAKTKQKEIIENVFYLEMVLMVMLVITRNYIYAVVSACIA